MHNSQSHSPTYCTSNTGQDGKPNLITQVRGRESNSSNVHNHTDDDDGGDVSSDASISETLALERRLVRKVDLRLCIIAGILCSLNLIDSGIISSASVSKGFFEDLELGVGNRYVSFPSALTLSVS